MCSAGAGPEGGLQPRLLDACRGWVVRSSSSGLPSLAAPLVAAVVTSLHAADAGGDCSGFSVWVLNVLDGLQFSIRSESEEASHATVLMPLLLISLIALEVSTLPVRACVCCVCMCKRFVLLLIYYFRCSLAPRRPPLLI